MAREADQRGRQLERQSKPPVVRVETGLSNMRFFDPLLERELAASARDGTGVGLIMLDVDHFKPFNDRHGHPAGDAALRALGALLRSTVRTADTIARYGGEEFVILLPRPDAAGYDYAELREKQQGSYYGIGLVIQNRAGKTVVITAMDGTPAFRMASA